MPTTAALVYIKHLQYIQYFEKMYNLLNDNGINGDIILNDDVFSRKISNDIQVLRNDLTNVTGIVFMSYYLNP